MQFDMFAEPPEPVERPLLELLEHFSTDYGPRTGVNARSAELTVAFALNFDTAGERLTAKLAGKKYLGIAFGSDITEAAKLLASRVKQTETRTLNVAGNGIYSFAEKQLRQEDVNRWVFEVLRRVHESVGLTHVRSGGQTGVDTAGLVAAIALGIPATGLYPKGFKHRLSNRKDVYSDAHTLETWLRNQANALL